MNALQDGGTSALSEVEALVPGIVVHTYRPDTLDLDEALHGADVVIVHEWNAPELVAAIGRKRSASGAFTLLFHDTHHRAVSAPHEIGIFDIDAYDGVLVFGEVLREVYLAHGWARQVFTLHEAADTELFRPLPGRDKDADLIWVGNWGDGERSAELHEFLLEPVSRLGLKARKDILVAGSTRDVLNILQDMPEERRKAIAAAGRRCVLQNHTAQHRAQQLETYYREAMASRPRRPIEAVA